MIPATVFQPMKCLLLWFAIKNDHTNLNLTFSNIGITVREIWIKPKTVVDSQFKYCRARCYFDLPGKDGEILEYLEDELELAGFLGVQ